MGISTRSKHLSKIVIAVLLAVSMLSTSQVAYGAIFSVRDLREASSTKTSTVQESKAFGLASLISRLFGGSSKGSNPGSGNDNNTTTQKPSGKTISETGIVYKNTDSGRCNYDIKYVDDGKSKPIIVCVHGGSWYKGSKSETNAIVSYFVPKGYVVANVEYENITQGVYVLGQIDEIIEAVKSVAESAESWQGDKDRIVLVGFSAGAQLAARAAQIISSRPSNYSFKLVAFLDYSGPCDLTKITLTQQQSYIFDGQYGDLDSKIALVNPISFVNSSMVPTFIVHGLRDTTVPVESADSFYEALVRAGVKVEYVRLSGLKHTLNMSYYGSRSLSFLDKYLP